MPVPVGSKKPNSGYVMPGTYTVPLMEEYKSKDSSCERELIWLIEHMVADSMLIAWYVDNEYPNSPKAP